MSWARGLVVDGDAGWKDITVTKGRTRRRGWPLFWSLAWNLVRGVWLAAAVLVGFLGFNALISASTVPALWLWAAGLPWLALAVAVLAAGGYGAWFWWAAESFDRRVVSPLRMWWRRLRYGRKWADLMVGTGLTVVNRRRRELAPRLVRIRQGRFADVLTVRLPDGLTAATFADALPEICEALRAREARIMMAPRRRFVPAILRNRAAREFGQPDYRPGTVYLRLSYGDPLVHVVTATPLTDMGAVDFATIAVGRRDDGKPWTVSLLGTHLLLAGATGAGKGSVLWAILAALGPGIRSGVVQVVGLDPKGGMELGFGRELFRTLVTMDGPDAEEEAVRFLEDLAADADRRASLLAGHARTLQPSTSLPFLVVVIDELASVTAFLSDSKRRQRADAALGRLLTKGRAPGMCVIGALQDPRKEVVRWRDLFPTRIALRLVEASQVDLVLGDGARKRGAKCDHISETAPGVGYVAETGSKAVTRVRAAYLTDDDIRRLATTFRPGPAMAEGLHIIEGGDAA